MMKTPIIDFVNNYKNQNSIRMHMPGHKGKSILGYEDTDITEIDGADVLYHSDGIIKSSEENASKLFGCPTFYSAEGSSLCIRAMLFLAMTYNKTGSKPTILAARNVHKTFITAAALLDLDVCFLYGKGEYYHSCVITKDDVEASLASMENKPFAVYLTSPDYLGYITDIKGISAVCKKYGVLLLVDNAHGAYLKFLNPSLFPIDLGADMCASSAHKTLPAITGAAYLHTSNNAYFIEHAKEALAMFASTSPSYLILQSLDKVNAYLDDEKGKIGRFCEYLATLKNELINNGYTLLGDEKMKITINSKAYGYSGYQMADYLADNNIIAEFSDDDFVVLMPTPENDISELEMVKRVLLSLERKSSIRNKTFESLKREKGLSIREASFSCREVVDIDDSLNRILADTAVTCPPAVPIVVCGEVIDNNAIEMFRYYKVNKLSVVKK